MGYGLLCGLWVWRRRTNRRSRCPPMSNPSTSSWTAWPDGPRRWNNRMAAQHLPRDLAVDCNNSIKRQRSWIIWNNKSINADLATVTIWLDSWRFFIFIRGHVWKQQLLTYNIVKMACRIYSNILLDNQCFERNDQLTQWFLTGVTRTPWGYETPNVFWDTRPKSFYPGIHAQKFKNVMSTVVSAVNFTRG